MPADTYPIITLKDLLATRTLPAKLPLIYVAKSELKTLLSESQSVTRLPAGGHRAVLAPLPGTGGGHLFIPCYADDPDVVCLPSGIRGPGGLVFDCRCGRASPNRGGGFTPVDNDPPTLDTCKIGFTIKGVLTCFGKCAQLGKKCTLKYKFVKGKYTFGCFC